MGKQSLQVFLKILWENGAVFPAQFYQTLFTGMGYSVESKQQVKIGGQKFRDPVVDADQIPAAHGFFNLIAFKLSNIPSGMVTSKV